MENETDEQFDDGGTPEWRERNRTHIRQEVPRGANTIDRVVSRMTVFQVIMLPVFVALAVFSAIIILVIIAAIFDIGHGVISSISSR